jgi:tetratricopeptide (TPR) repeat protein
MSPPLVFISYSFEDEAWKDRLVKHLNVLALGGLIEVWDDRRVAAGADWRTEIEAAMGRAQVAVLLISASFLGSKLIDEQVLRLLERRRKGGLRVIPVLVEPCALESVGRLSALQCWPRDRRPLALRRKHEIEASLAALAVEIISPSTAPSPAEVETSIEPASQRNVPPRRLRLWLGISLVVASLSVLAFVHSGRARSLEPEIIEFNCPPQQKQDSKKYRRYLEDGRKALAELDIPAAKRSFKDALCNQDGPEARIGFAQTLAELGQVQKARGLAAKALSGSAGLPKEKRLLIEAQVSALRGLWAQAVAQYQELLGEKPGDVEIIIALAEAQIKAGEPDEALATVGKASAAQDPRLSLVKVKAAMKSGSSWRELLSDSLAMVERDGHPYIAAKGYILHAQMLADLQRSQEASTQLDKARKLAKGNPLLSWEAMNAEADLHLDLGDFQEALRLYQEAALVNGDMADSPLMAVCRYKLGNLYDMLGDLTRARHHLRIALYHMGDNQPIDQANAANLMGLVSEHQGDLKGARWYMSQASLIYHGIQPTANEASSFCNLAQIDWLLLNTNSSASEVKRCRELANASADRDLQAIASATEGDFSLWQGELDHALEKHQEALKLRQELRNDGTVADSRFSLATVQIERGQTSDAAIPARQALLYYQDQKAVDWVALTQVLLAQLHLAQRDLAAARRESDQAEQRATVSEYLELRVRSALAAARVADAEGKFPEALAAARRALSEAKSHKHPAFLLEAGLVLGELESEHPDPAAPHNGCDRLRKVEEDAKQVYGLVALKAHKILLAAQRTCPEPQ